MPRENHEPLSVKNGWMEVIRSIFFQEAFDKAPVTALMHCSLSRESITRIRLLKGGIGSTNDGLPHCSKLSVSCHYSYVINEHTIFDTVSDVKMASPWR